MEQDTGIILRRVFPNNIHTYCNQRIVQYNIPKRILFFNYNVTGTGYT